MTFGLKSVSTATLIDLSTPSSMVRSRTTALLVNLSPEVTFRVMSPAATLNCAVPTVSRSVKKTLLPRKPTTGAMPPVTRIRASIGVVVPSFFTFTVSVLIASRPVKSCVVVASAVMVSGTLAVGA